KVFLIDGDNNINLGLRGVEMLTEDSYVMIFHSKAMEITKFKKKLAGCRAQIDFIESVRSGKNSLDFQITTELGFLSHNKDLESAFIISCDKGYDAAVDYVKSRYSSKFKELDRKESIFDTFQLAFALKAKTAAELNHALMKEYGPEHGTMVFNHLQSLFGTAPSAKTVSAVEDPEVEPDVQEAPKPPKKSSRDRKKTRPDRKPKAASVHTKNKKLIEPEVVEAIVAEKVEPKLEAAATVVVEKVEAVAQKASEIKDLPLRFNNTRTDEQNQSYYKSRDLRKKTKPQVEAASEAEVKVEAAHVETVVELVNENRQEERKAENSQRPQRREGERRSHTPKQSEVKDVTVKARPQQKPAEATPKAPVKKASGQNTGFFGRMFGKKKK
ncbi:MAG: hypothetical protein IKT25_07440, partial [Firmicutes bacterium]|nr:hypothetical protein [Bacillota bacterium]